MAQIEANRAQRFWGLFFASPEERLARKKQRLKAREMRRELDRQVAKDLRESGLFDEHVPDAYFYRHHYF